MIWKFLSLFGIGCTIAFGAYAIWLAKRYAKGRLALVRDQVIPLFDTIVKDLPGLQVTLDSVPVSESLVLLKAYLVNTGSHDVRPDAVEQPIRLTLGDNSRWIKPKVLRASQGVHIELQVSRPNVLTFSAGQLRTGEYVYFQVLAELSDASDQKPKAPKSSTSEMFAIQLKCDHRIADFDRARVLPPVRPVRLDEWLLFILPLALVPVFIYLVFGTSLFREPLYEYKTPEGTTIEVTWDFASHGSVRLTGVGSHYHATVPFKDFDASSKRTGIDVMVFSWHQIPIVLSLLTLIFPPLTLLRRYIVARPILKAIGGEMEGHSNNSM